MNSLTSLLIGAVVQQELSERRTHIAVDVASSVVDVPH